MAAKNTKPFDLEKALIGSPAITAAGRKAIVAGYNPAAEINEAIVGWVDGQVCWWRTDGKHAEDSDFNLEMVPSSKKMLQRLRLSSSGVPVYKIVEEHDRELLTREPESHERWVWVGPIEEKEIPVLNPSNARVANAPPRRSKSRMHRKTA